MGGLAEELLFRQYQDLLERRLEHADAATRKQLQAQIKRCSNYCKQLAQEPPRTGWGAPFKHLMARSHPQPVITELPPDPAHMNPAQQALFLLMMCAELKVDYNPACFLPIAVNYCQAMFHSLNQSQSEQYKKSEDNRHELRDELKAAFVDQLASAALLLPDSMRKQFILVTNSREFNDLMDQCSNSPNTTHQNIERGFEVFYPVISTLYMGVSEALQRLSQPMNNQPTVTQPTIITDDSNYERQNTNAVIDASIQCIPAQRTEETSTSAPDSRPHSGK